MVDGLHWTSLPMNIHGHTKSPRRLWSTISRPCLHRVDGLLRMPCCRWPKKDRPRCTLYTQTRSIIAPAQRVGSSSDHFLAPTRVVDSEYPPANAVRFWARIPQVSSVLGLRLHHPKHPHGQGPFAMRPVLASGAPARWRACSLRSQVPYASIPHGQAAIAQPARRCEPGADGGRPSPSLVFYRQLPGITTV